MTETNEKMDSSKNSDMIGGEELKENATLIDKKDSKINGK
jgi:hypothetical protein